MYTRTHAYECVCVCVDVSDDVAFITCLHHEDHRVESYHHHDEVLKRSGHHQPPDTVLQRVTVLWHVATERLRVDRKVDALFLKQEIHQPS